MGKIWRIKEKGVIFAYQFPSTSKVIGGRFLIINETLANVLDLLKDNTMIISENGDEMSIKKFKTLNKV
jgi:hypothetical protein